MSSPRKGHLRCEPRFDISHRQQNTSRIQVNGSNNVAHGSGLQIVTDERILGAAHNCMVDENMFVTTLLLKTDFHLALSFATDLDASLFMVAALVEQRYGCMLCVHHPSESEKLVVGGIREANALRFE